MIYNAILHSPSVAFAAGAVSCTTIIPAIEAALRAIIAVGQLVGNVGQFGYTKFNFNPPLAFTADPEYQNVGQDFLQKLNNRIQNSKLPKSCYPTGDIYSSIRLKHFGSTTWHDAESLKEHSKLYQSFLEDSNIEISNHKILIPKNFSEPTIFLLRTYLVLKSYVDDGVLERLSKQEFLELYELAGYLQLTDLENRCMRVVVKQILASGSTNFDAYKEVINLNVYQKKLNKLFRDINQFKTVNTKSQLAARLSEIKGHAWIAIKGIAKNIFFAAVLTIHSSLPFVGPGFMLLIICATHKSDELHLITMRVIYALPLANDALCGLIAMVTYVALFIIF